MQAYWIKYIYKIGDYEHTKEILIDASSLKYAKNKIIRKMKRQIELNNIKLNTIKIVDYSIIGYM